MKQSISPVPVEVMAYEVANQALTRHFDQWYWEFFQYTIEAGHTWEDLIYEVLDRVTLRYPSGRPRRNWRKLIDAAAREVVLEMKRRYPENLVREAVSRLYH